jgi:adenine phosphoribosyltransferase
MGPAVQADSARLNAYFAWRVLGTGKSRSLREAPRVHLAELKELIRTIPDFPISGILFRDITPLIKDPDGFRSMIDLFVERFKDERIDVVVGVEARGYILAAPLAYELGAGFVPVRKPGKLPGSKMTEEYALEYGTNSLEVHDDAVGRGKRVLIVDDVLATGGTAAATGRLVERLGAEIVEFAFLIELEALGGRKVLGAHKISSLIKY